jgi:hypothetical protein
VTTAQRTTVSFLVAALATLPAACANETRSPAAPAPSSAGSPAAGVASAAAAPAPCSDDPRPANVARSTGSAISATVVSQSGPSMQWDIAVPGSGTGAVPELAEPKLPQDWAEPFDRAYDRAGAFTYGGMRLQLNLENRSDRQITVTDVRPVNIRAVCLPAGLLVLYGSEGGDFVNMVINLDAGRPVAHERSPEGNVSTEPYFGSHTLPVAAGQSQDISLDLQVAKRAYAFDIAVSYVDAGAVETQIVNRRGRPFRAAASVCPSPDNRARLSEADAALLRNHRFDKVMTRTGELDATSNYIVREQTMSEYLRRCQTW